MLTGTDQLVFIVIQILMFGTTAALIAFTFDRSFFSLHPLSMAIGFLVFLDEGFFAARFIKVSLLLNFTPTALRLSPCFHFRLHGARWPSRYTCSVRASAYCSPCWAPW